ncbi:uncharacterized protein [Diadema setosum]|uniref:uncharacterized protein n=1 Tax=Diadema setosum TaxID=31175 RepID=UPI003B3A9BAF
MGEISDATLIELSERIPLDITRLGVQLGFSLTDMKRYKASNYSGGDVTSQGTLQMFLDWRNDVKSASQRRKLKTAMGKAELGGIAEEFFGSSSRPTAGNEMASSGSDEDNYSPEIVQTDSKISFSGTGSMENVNVKGQEANVGSLTETTQGASQPATTSRKRAGKGAGSAPKVKQQGSSITFTNMGPSTNLNVVGQEANVDSSKTVSQTASSKTASKRKGGSAEGDEETEETEQLSNSVMIFAMVPFCALVAYVLYFWLL